MTQEVDDDEGTSFLKNLFFFLVFKPIIYFLDSIDDDTMYSICTYIAENDDSLNLVEGEKVYVIERHNADWWFVKKHLTSEKGWVPCQYLMNGPNYTHYVQKKLNEKIDKIPVFDSKKFFF